MFAKNKLFFLKCLGIFWLNLVFVGCFSVENKHKDIPLKITTYSAPDTNLIPDEIIDEPTETPIFEPIDWETLTSGDTISQNVLFENLLELFPDSLPAHQPIPERLYAYRTADNFINEEVELRLFYPKWDACAYLAVTCRIDDNYWGEDRFHLFKKIDTAHWKLMYEYQFDGNAFFTLKNQFLDIDEGHENDLGKYYSSNSLYRIEKDSVVGGIAELSYEHEYDYLHESTEKELRKIHPTLGNISSRYSSSSTDYKILSKNRLLIEERHKIGLEFNHKREGKPFKFYDLLLNSPEYPCDAPNRDDFYLELIQICIQKTLVWDAKKYAYVQVSEKVENGNFPKHFLKNLSSSTLEYHNLKKEFPKIARQIYDRANKAQKAGLDTWLLIEKHDD